MTSTRLILASLRHYWRTHLGVLLGVIIAAAVLTGAMVVGDSVRLSLRDMALARLGQTHLALVPHERYFRTSLKDRIEHALDAPAASVMLLPGTARAQKTDERAGAIQVLGVDRDFWAMMWPVALPENERPAPPAADKVILSATLAKKLGVRQGDEVLLRVSKPSLLPRDAPLTRTDVADISLALRVTVEFVLNDDQPNPGRFGLAASQLPPLNAFVNLQWLQNQLKLPEQANLMLVGNVGASAKPGAMLVAANAVLMKEWRLDDVNVQVRPAAEQGMFELRSSRIFLDPPLVEAAIAAAKEKNITALGVLTYLINEFDAGGRKAPYSMGTGIGVLHEPAAPTPRRDNPSSTVTWRDLIVDAKNPPTGVGGRSTSETSDPTPESPPTPQSPPTPVGGSPGSPRPIILNDWLASDLRVNTGDTIRLKYFVVGPSRELVEQTSEPFTVARIVPLEGAAADRTFLPEFPDLPDENTTFSQWKPGFKMTRTIRKIDDDYWAKHRGTPKAFISLEAGQSMWQNRFGNMTAVRFVGPDLKQADLEAAIRARLDPAAIGLSFVPVREDALAASSQGFDFAQLFLGFSFFLIVAALLLTGLLFVFAIEQRSQQVGTLLAIGFRPQKVRRLLLAEGLLLAALGSAIGIALGLGYTSVLLRALTTIWRDAISTSALAFHVQPVTLVIAFAASVAVAGLTIWLVLRRQARTPARDLLAGSPSSTSAPSRPASPSKACGLAGSTRPTRIAALLSLLLILASLAVIFTTGFTRGTAAAGAFFGAGSMLLLAGLAASYALLTRLAVSSNQKSQITYKNSKIASSLSLSSLALRNAARRRGRSLATIALLACGAFLVIAIGAFWLDAGENAQDRKSGTGGFALYGESTLPVLADLNTDEGLDKFALDREDLPGVKIVSMRVRDGDDASCLNLNRAQNPRLVGVKTFRMMELDRFTFANPGFAEPRMLRKGWSPWSDLHNPNAKPNDPSIVNAIGDANTITYGLGLGVGDMLEYADEAGQSFRIRIAATLSNSILQGSLFIDEEQFKQRFPSVSGHRAFLIDAPWDEVADVEKKLESALADVGLELTPTVERLAAFNAVQNTYLGIFQALGGLGLLLGSFGLGVVVLRNVLERRGELALLAAVGFAPRKLRQLVIREHGLLLALGLIIGLVAAVLAILPAILAPGAHVPYALLAAILAGVIVSGLLWTVLATRAAVRGPLLAALRND